MAKIAAGSGRAWTLGTGNIAPGRADARVLARGDGWSISDVICTCGPRDHAFEEQHSDFCVAVVLTGSFQYRSGRGREVMTPGSLLLGNPGQFFECSHEHATGDRCISFHYSAQYIEGPLSDAGASGVRPGFRALRLPPLRSFSRLVAQTWANTEIAADGRWEELGFQLATQTAALAGPLVPGLNSIPPSAEARVTRAVREIERHSDGHLNLAALAHEAGLSRYHFLRVFENVTGVTPHQYVRRARLRKVAARLMVESTRILDIALACGFGDVSNFNRAFHAEFGVTPRAYRRQRARHGYSDSNAD